MRKQCDLIAFVTALLCPMVLRAQVNSTADVPRSAEQARSAGTQDGARDDAAANNATLLKVQLGSTDEEWKVIGPKIQKLTTARLALESLVVVSGDAPPQNGNQVGRGGGPGGNDAFGGPATSVSGGGPGGWRPGGPGGDGPPGGGMMRGGGRPDFRAIGGGPQGFGSQNTAGVQALTALQTAIADPNSSLDDLRQKIAAVREARAAAHKVVESAQADLLALITPTQEALLADLGYID